MLTPRYLYREDFAQFEPILQDAPHRETSFRPGEELWSLDEPILRVHYVRHGIARTSFVNEDGHARTLYFHGPSTVFPGCHEAQFKLELSLVTCAITQMETWEFAVGEFRELARREPELMSAVVENYARQINLLIYESAHQEYNSVMVKLCNLLLLLCQDSSGNAVRLPQEELADILAVNRVNVSKALARLREEGVVLPHRGWVEVLDMDRLAAHCSYESLP